MLKNSSEPTSASGWNFFVHSFVASHIAPQVKSSKKPAGFIAKPTTLSFAVLLPVIISSIDLPILVSKKPCDFHQAISECAWASFADFTECVAAIAIPFAIKSMSNTAQALIIAVGCCITTERFPAIAAAFCADTSRLDSSPP